MSNPPLPTKGYIADMIRTWRASTGRNPLKIVCHPSMTDHINRLLEELGETQVEVRHD